MQYREIFSALAQGWVCNQGRRQILSEKNHLYVLWTNDNPITMEKMVFMYTVNSLARGWWDEITLIIWGTPAKLVSEDKKAQRLVQNAIKAGVQLVACKACADQLGVSDDLEKMNIEVKYTGELLTDILKGEEKLITI